MSVQACPQQPESLLLLVGQRLWVRVYRCLLAVGLAGWFLILFFEGACGGARVAAIEQWAITHQILIVEQPGGAPYASPGRLFYPGLSSPP